MPDEQNEHVTMREKFRRWREQNPDAPVQPPLLSDKDINDGLRSLTEAALDRIQETIIDPNNRRSFDAAALTLAYVMGKPRQPTEKDASADIKIHIIGGLPSED